MTDHIQINDVSPRVQYQANGVQSAFTFPFAIFKLADLEVWLDDIRQSDGYAVSGVAVATGGTVLLAAPPAEGTRVTLRRQLSIQRTGDYQADGLIRAKTLNDELDYTTAALQQVAEEAGRAVRRSPTSPSLAALILPEPSPLRGLKWNADGSGLVNTTHDPDSDTDATLAAARAESAAQEAKAARDQAVAIATSVQQPLSAPANLSDVPDKAAARANLEVLSAAETLAVLPGAQTLQRLAFLERNLAVNTLRDQIDTGWSVLKMVDGIADEFEDTSGVVLAPAAPMTGKTYIGTMTEKGGLAAAFDGVTTQVETASAYQTGNSAATVGVDLGPSSAAAFAAIRVHGSSNYGFNNPGTNGAATLSYHGSNDNAAWTLLASGSHAAIGTPWEAPVFDIQAYRYHRVTIAGTGDKRCAEVELVPSSTVATLGASHDATNSFWSNPSTGVLAAPLTATTLAANQTRIDRSQPLIAGARVAAIQVYGLVAETVTVMVVERTGSSLYSVRASASFTHRGTGWDGVTLATPYVVPSVGSHFIAVHTTAAPTTVAASRLMASVAGKVSGDFAASETTAATTAVGVVYRATDMTLVSTSFPAEAVPAEARLVLLHQPLDNVDVAADCAIAVSRDGGQSWSAGTLADDGAFDANTNILTATIDLSGQPTGTAMRWRFATHNHKSQRLHGVWLQWR